MHPPPQVTLLSVQDAGAAAARAQGAARRSVAATATTAATPLAAEADVPESTVDAVGFIGGVALRGLASAAPTSAVQVVLDAAMPAGQAPSATASLQAAYTSGTGERRAGSSDLDP